MSSGNTGSEAFSGPQMGQSLQLPISEQRGFRQNCEGLSGFKFYLQYPQCNFFFKSHLEFAKSAKYFTRRLRNANGFCKITKNIWAPVVKYHIPPQILNDYAYYLSFIYIQ